MKVSLKWLNNYVNLDGLTPECIAQKLTFAGIEVEDIVHLASGTNLVIGEIIECVNHPDSNHLHILKVDEGKYGIEQIVCGAPNARVGLKVIVARVGAILPKITIVKSSIRGVESNGMCCSLLELGVDQKYLTEAQINGIEELPSDAEVGNDKVLEYLGLDDTILDLKLLANRSDCLAMQNVAKEVAALFEREVRLPEIKELDVKKSDFKVNSQTELCKQFAIREVKNIKVKESPKWLKEKLIASGVRPINNIVDIGNFVMLLTGQPLHMYDLDKLSSKSLCARSDFSGEFVALDEKTYKLQEGDLVIMNEDKVMCLGGVMGSLSCAVDENTKNIAIEAANFDAKTIRHTSTRLNLISESSQRFVKGINKDQYEYVLDLTANLLIDLAEAKEVYEIKSFDELDHNQLIIESSCSEINNRLGSEFDHDLIKHTLERVGIVISDFDGDSFKAYIPNHRIDIKLSADLSEEVIRLLGFEHIKSSLPKQEVSVGALKEGQLRKRQIRDLLISNGFYETLNYTLVDDKLSKYFSSLNDFEQYQLLHPMTEDHKIVRSTLLPSLLNTLRYNLSRQNKNLKMFELSDVYTKVGFESHLAVIMQGEDEYRHLMQKIPFSFAHAKGVFEAIMGLLAIEPMRYKMVRVSDKFSELHPGRAVEIYIGKDLVGIIGEAHPNLMKEFDLGKMPVVMLELNLSKFLDMRVSPIKVVPPSRYQSVERDLALVVKKEVTAQEIIKVIKQSGHNLIRQVDIFDVYEGEHVSLGFKSVALKMIYEDYTKGFTSEEITSIEKDVINALETKLSIKLRG
ncbi:MAG: phenylalanine--tRNA ligase subunit beta [Erysipelotrichales bacterium]|nr:phenylalanine--tRNA ligase subunit beta [Erysipelotrichales bacterium]